MMHSVHCDFHSWRHSLDALKQGPRGIAEALEEGAWATDPCVRFCQGRKWMSYCLQ